MSDCLICGAKRDPEDCHIVVLTEAERAQVANPLDEYVYCKPCWGVLSDPVNGPALISGIAHHHLRDAGVPDAEAIVARFRSALVNRAVRRS